MTVMQHAAIMMENGEVGVAELPERLLVSRFLRRHGKRTSTGWASLSEIQCEYVKLILAHVGGNQSEAARILEISRNTLRKKLRSSQVTDRPTE